MQEKKFWCKCAEKTPDPRKSVVNYSLFCFAWEGVKNNNFDKNKFCDSNIFKNFSQ